MSSPNGGATAVTALAFSPRGDWLLAGHQVSDHVRQRLDNV